MKQWDFFFYLQPRNTWNFSLEFEKCTRYKYFHDATVRQESRENAGIAAGYQIVSHIAIVKCSPLNFQIFACTAPWIYSSSRKSPVCRLSIHLPAATVSANGPNWALSPCVSHCSDRVACQLRSKAFIASIHWGYFAFFSADRKLSCGFKNAAGRVEAIKS